jgi:hypothetical protein
MFVVVYQNNVVLGPMKWNRFRFQNFLMEEHEITTILPKLNESVIVVNEDCTIYPVQTTPDPQFNSTTQMLNGPFWQFTDTEAISSYKVRQLNIDAVKNMMKARAAKERYRKEISGTTATIQGKTVTLSTDRDSRTTINNTYLITDSADTVQWKFSSAWLTLSKEELALMVATINAHVQEQFTWELEKVTEIDSCTTSEELATIVIEEPIDFGFPIE